MKERRGEKADHLWISEERRREENRDQDLTSLEGRGREERKAGLAGERKPEREL